MEYTTGNPGVRKILDERRGNFNAIGVARGGAVGACTCTPQGGEIFFYF